MSERLLILALFGLCLTIGFALWRLSEARRLAALARRAAGRVDGGPAILYFTAPGCAQCRLQQTPILERLLDEVGAPIRLHKVDAIEEGELARAYGILTVPTTVLLDAAGRPRAINHGLATAERLRAQLRDLLN